MKIIILLILCSTLQAQEWIYTPDRKVAEKFVAKLDAACGYPNPSTKTWTSVEIQVITNKTSTNYAVLVPDGVFAPKLSGMGSLVYFQAKTLLPKTRLADVPLTNSTSIVTEFSKVSLLPTVKDELSQNFLLVTKEVVEAKEPEVPVKIQEVVK